MLEEDRNIMYAEMAQTKAMREPIAPLYSGNVMPSHSHHINDPGHSHTYATPNYNNQSTCSMMQSDRYVIELTVNIGNNSTQWYGPACLNFYTEEEFLQSFVNVYDAINTNKKFVTTASGVYNVENISSIHAKEYKNDLQRLLSPIYVLERAKELKYV